MIKKQYLYPLLITIVWAISVVSRLKFNGLAYGFDYGLYQPDGMHYTFRTLTFLGNSDLESARSVSEWYAANGIKHSQVNPTDLLPENNRVWGVVSPRILYPLLSVPFVALLGIPGMLAIPALSFLLLLITIYKLGKKYNQEGFSVILSLLLTTSVTTTRWMISNCTDALLAGIACLAVLVLISEVSDNKKMVTLSMVAVLGVITRFSLPIWVALALVICSYRKFRVGAILLLTSTLATIPTFLSQPDDAVLPGTSNLSGFDKLFLVPVSFVKIVFVELAQLAALDRILLFFLVSSLAIGVSKFKKLENRYLILVCLAVFGIGAINGVAGVNFRYQLPMIPFMAWTLIAAASTNKLQWNLGKYGGKSP